MTKPRAFLSSLILLASLLLPAAHERAAAAPPAPELDLLSALDLMRDTPAIRAAGVWYADYAQAERVYGVSGVTTMGDPRIAAYFTAIRPLRPGTETGVAQLVEGRWRQRFGYDLLNITSEIYTSAGNYPLAIAVGGLDTAYIGHVLAMGSYTRDTHTLPPSDGAFYIRAPLLDTASHDAIMNALLLGSQRIVAGVRPADVANAAPALAGKEAMLGQSADYRALAVALGAVEGAYVAATIPYPFVTPPFSPLPGGHRGPALHPFGLYALAYQEPRPGERYMEIGLVYPSDADAQADLPTLRARLQRERLPLYDTTWRRLIDGSTLTASGRVLLARLRLRPSTPPTLWQDLIVEQGLSLLSK